MTNDNKSKEDATAKRFFVVIDIIRRKWRRIAAIVVCVTTLSAIYIFSLPRTYQSEAILLPETSGSTSISGSLGAMASMAGVKLGTGQSDDAIYPEFYPKVLSSTVFLSELLNDTIYCKRLGKKVNVYDYIKEYQKKPWWKSVISFFKSKKKVEPNDNAHINPRKPSKAQQRTMTELSDASFCSVDKKTDMIVIRATAQDADAAQQIADLICTRLQTYITNYRTNKARRDVAHAKKITTDAYNKYVEAQQEYAAYCDAHENLSLAAYKQVEARLENEMQLAYDAYTQYSQQKQIAEVRLQERTPVYATIQPSVEPIKPSGPKRMFTVIGFFLLSFFGSVVWYVGKNAVRSAKTLPQDEE